MLSRVRIPTSAAIVALLWPLSASGAEYYVSPAGNDSSSGTVASPFKTIQRAADVMAAGDTCHIASGTYKESIRPAQSGQDGKPISFVGDPKSAVIVTSARPITGWTLDSGNVWKASVDFEFDQLFVDHQRMIIARWPDLQGGDEYRPTFLESSDDGGGTSLIDTVNLTQPAGTWDGASLYVVPGLGWAAEQRVITSYDADAHQLHFDQPINWSEYYGVDKGSPYYLYNRRELLDAPSEWYLDRGTGTVFLWLPDGGDPNSHVIEAPDGQGGFNLDDLSNIELSNLTVSAGLITMAKANQCHLADVRYLYPQNKDNDFWGETGALVVTGSENVIERSEIAQAPGRCVVLGGSNNTLRSSHIHHCDFIGIYNEIVSFAGPHNTVSDCSLHDTGRDGVNVLTDRDVTGSVLEHTEIYDTGLIAKDCGGFYVYKTDGKGMVLRYNVVHGMRPKGTPQYGGIQLGMGIYFDDDSSNFLVHHNVAFDTAHISLFLHLPSRGIRVYNNTAVGVGDGWAEPLGGHAGNLGPDSTGAEVANNLGVVLDNRDWCISFDAESNMAYHHNGYFRSSGDGYNSLGLEDTAVVGDPLFVDIAKRDFSIKAGSPMIDKGVEIAGVTEGFVGAAPDIGAYEMGGSERPGPRVTPGPATCTPDCGTRICGPDPVCGESCGSCAVGQSCSSAGLCVSGEAGTGTDAAVVTDGAADQESGAAGDGSAESSVSSDSDSGGCGCRAVSSRRAGLSSVLVLAGAACVLLRRRRAFPSRFRR